MFGTISSLPFMANSSAEGRSPPCTKSALFAAPKGYARVAQELLNPFRTAVPFWGQTPQPSSSLSPKRDCGSKGVNRNTPKGCLCKGCALAKDFLMWRQQGGCLPCSTWDKWAVQVVLVASQARPRPRPIPHKSRTASVRCPLRVHRTAYTHLSSVDHPGRKSWRRTGYRGTRFVFPLCAVRMYVP